MMPSVRVSAGVHIPSSLINPRYLAKELEVKYWKMGEEAACKVSCYRRAADGIIVPRDFGLRLAAEEGWEVSSSLSPGHPVDFGPAVDHSGEWSYQEGFVSQIVQATKELNDFLVSAATGKGKTRCCLSVFQRLGRTALVIVDQDNLLTQWMGAAKSALGLTDDDIGVVQGDRCDYKGKKLVIGMVQSLVQRRYVSDLYRYFGVMVIDEVHMLGAPTFSKLMFMFSAETRFGMSATVDRGDSLQRTIHLHLGRVAAELTDTHDPSYLMYLTSDTVYSWYANISPKAGRIISEVAADTVRNDRLVKVILWLYNSGRDTLVVSDRIEHLEALRAMCILYGMPESVTGLYTGYYNVWAFEKDPVPSRPPAHLEPGAKYTPVRLSLLKKKAKRAHLAAMLESKSVLFVTFGIFSKGVDKKSLAGGIDCTPRSKATQVHGRILRKAEGKQVPIWVTVRDVCSYRLEHQFLRRLDDYIDSAARVCKWSRKSGAHSVDVRELKRSVRLNKERLELCEIKTNGDGSYTLATRPTLIERAGLRETPTARVTRYPTVG